MLGVQTEQGKGWESGRPLSHNSALTYTQLLTRGGKLTELLKQSNSLYGHRGVSRSGKLGVRVFLGEFIPTAELLIGG